jgi:predicted Zn-dependent protease
MMRPQDIIETALAAGGGDLAVLVTSSSQVNLRWAGNSLTTNGDAVDQEVDVIAFHRGATGTATATVSGQVRDGAAVRDLVARARAAAGGAAGADDAAPLVAGGQSPDWSAPPVPASGGRLSGVAGGLGEAFRRGDADGVRHYGYAEHDATTVFLGTTAGTRLRHTQTTGRLELTAKSADGSGSAWHGSADVAADEGAIAAIDDRLRRALGWQRHTISVAPGRHTVLLSPSAVADLMTDLYWSADAQSAVDGRSVFSRPGGGTRVGDRLGSEVTLFSDPDPADPTMRCERFVTATAATESTSPFDNGIGLTATRWIDSGRLEHLVTTRHSARLAGLPVTPGIDNLILQTDCGAGSLDDVAARLGSGLLVTCLWYNRIVDPQTLLLTGLTRDGVYVVRDGEIVGACGNFRFNESPVSVLSRIVDSGTAERTLAREMGDYFNRAVMPPLVVADFNMSTASDAR